MTWRELMRLAVDGGGGVREFWDLTIGEILVFADVTTSRASRRREDDAWIVASIGNLMGAKPPLTVHGLLGRANPNTLEGAAADAAFMAFIGAAPKR